MTKAWSWKRDLERFAARHRGEDRGSLDIEDASPSSRHGRDEEGANLLRSEHDGSLVESRAKALIDDDLSAGLKPYAPALK